MKKRNVTYREFQCPTCGAHLIAYKKSSRRTSVGHIKTMWCWKCKSEKQMKQIF